MNDEEIKLQEALLNNSSNDDDNDDNPCDCGIGVFHYSGTNDSVYSASMQQWIKEKTEKEKKQKELEEEQTTKKKKDEQWMDSILYLNQQSLEKEDKGKEGPE